MNRQIILALLLLLSVSMAISIEQKKEDLEWNPFDHLVKKAKCMGCRAGAGFLQAVVKN